MNAESPTHPMIRLLNHYWWLTVLRGVAGIVFGLLTFAWPGLTLFTLVIFFGAYALVSGVLALVLGFQAPEGAPRFTGFFLPGLLGVAAGLVTFFLPGLTAITLVFIIGFWFLFLGFSEILLALRWRRVIHHEWLLIVAGAASCLFGAAILIWPGAGALALVYWIGAFAFVFGAMLVALGFRLRRWHVYHQKLTHGAAA